MKSRYVAFTQQPYCCVPACLQTVMYRRCIPLVEQEVLGYELGLTVPEEDAHMFTRVRTGAKPSSGWGTQIQNPDFSIDKMFTKLAIHLKLETVLVDGIKSEQELKSILEGAQDNSDVLVCFKDGKGGHVCVVDRLESDDAWLVDPERNRPKHRKVKVADLYKSIVEHDASNFAGCWIIREK